jgi:hypothetical protein
MIFPVNLRARSTHYEQAGSPFTTGESQFFIGSHYLPDLMFSLTENHHQFSKFLRLNLPAICRSSVV